MHTLIIDNVIDNKIIIKSITVKELQKSIEDTVNNIIYYNNNIGKRLNEKIINIDINILDANKDKE